MHYSGPRKVKVGDDVFEIASLGESLKVLGLNFCLSANQSAQAQELISRTRTAAAAHKDILVAPGSWHHKMKILRSLVESQFAWTAGALHWSSDDLRALNLVQLHACRSAFGIRRLGGESWVDWNARSLRFVRVWLVNQHFPRWSERVLTNNILSMAIGPDMSKLSMKFRLLELLYVRLIGATCIGGDISSRLVPLLVCDM